MNPYLNSSGFDSTTLTKHCLGCDEPLHGERVVHTDHVLASWSHYVLTRFPAVVATDEKGFTLEGLIAQPERVMLAKVPSHTGVSYCLDCLPSLTPEEDDNQYQCGSCGLVVDQTQDHSISELLWKRTNLVNGPFRIVYWHIECLPVEFDAIRTIRQERQSKL